MHRQGMSDSQCESQSQAREQEQGPEGVGALASRADQGEHERGVCENSCEGLCVCERHRGEKDWHPGYMKTISIQLADWASSPEGSPKSFLRQGHLSLLATLSLSL